MDLLSHWTGFKTNQCFRYLSTEDSLLTAVPEKWIFVSKLKILCNNTLEKIGK